MFENHKKESPIVSLLGMGGGISYPGFIRRGVDGYTISRSLRFNSTDSAYLNRTPSSAGNRKTWTFSAWLKLANLTPSWSADQQGTIFSASGSLGGGATIRNNGGLRFAFGADPSGTDYYRETVALFRDPSAWYHCVWVQDTTQSTGNRWKIYVNGVLQTLQNAGLGEIGLDATPQINNTGNHNIGSYVSKYDGYLADVHFIDGQTPGTATDDANGSVTGIPNAEYLTDFGEFDADTGVWNPIEYDGTYGTNGFHLDFSDNSTAAALGTDTSGNSNTWTVNNLTAVVDNNRYSQTTTGTAPTPYSTSGYVASFDGSTSTGFAWTPGTWAMDWTGLSSAITVSSSLRIYCYPRLGTLTVNINGSTVASITGNTVDWRTISFTGTINTISFSGTDTYSSVYAIEVDSSILVDYQIVGKNIDSLVDSPTNGTAGGEVVGNYCTLNPLNIGSNCTLGNGNLDYSYGGSATRSPTPATFGMASGKWYWEIIATASSVSPIATPFSGIVNTQDQALLGLYPGNTANGWGYYGATGVIRNNNTTLITVSTYDVNDVVGFAFDADSGKWWVSKNGVWQNSGDPSAGTGAVVSSLPSATYYPCVGDGAGSSTFNASVNFGQRAFAYTAPSGFKALCTANLPDPTIADGSTAMDAVLYTGNSSTQTISGLNFSPDWVWIKARSAAYSHRLWDVVRGATKGLISNGTDAEFTQTNGLTSFNSDGFSLGNQTNVNDSAVNYVAWAWDGGTSNATNPNGSIESTVMANPSAGFSIVTYTGNGTNGATVGHGLGVAPAFFIIKKRSATSSWPTYHQSLGAGGSVFLERTDAYSSDPTRFNNTAPSSTVVTLGAPFEGNVSDATYVMYCFAPVDGYSSFGSYTGNGSADGPFVYTGFRPRWIMYKVYSGDTGHWFIHDTARDPYNEAKYNLRANLDVAEATSVFYPLDILSNGFKIRSSNVNINGSGYGFVYAAFAEHPFKTARAR